MLRVILDVDTGIDDALALLLALHSPELDIVGVTCVAGNTTLDHVLANTLAVLDVAGARIPVYAGAHKPLVGPLRTATLFHGANGLGNVSLPRSSSRPEIEDAAAYLCRRVREEPGEITVIAVAPLTNIALAILRDRDFASHVGQLIVMGGAVHHAGNVNGVAEANFANDPEAAAAVAASGVNVLLVDLGATSQAVLPPERLGAVDAPGRQPWSALVIRLLHFYGQAYVDAGVSGAVLHDPLAVGIAALPELAAPVSMHLAVETAGTLTRGTSVGSLARRTSVMTQRDDHLDAAEWQNQNHNAHLARNIDGPRFLDLFVKRLGLE
ncbi:MAG: nucleoside hydrolase [Chloroflexota bacterium]